MKRENLSIWKDVENRYVDLLIVNLHCTITIFSFSNSNNKFSNSIQWFLNEFELH